MSNPLSFEILRKANMMRLPQFKNSQGGYAHTKEDGSDWIPAQWLQALIGEVGEFANIRKKYERGDIEYSEYVVLAKKEIADIATYLDLLALRALDPVGAVHPTGIDLGQAIEEKFNEVSERVKASVFIYDGIAIQHTNPCKP